LFCYKELDGQFAAVNAKSDKTVKIAERTVKRQRVEATVLNSLSPVSKEEICHTLPDVSPATMEVVLALKRRKSLTK
jgi:hypothetical protein